MAHPGFNPDDERAWWWKVAKHLDAAQLALVNAIAHNVDDPRPLQALQATLRESTTILLHILGAKGLMPGTNAPRPSQQHVQQHAQPPIPPPPWASSPSEPPPPWFPPDMAGDMAAAAAAAAAAAVMTPAPMSYYGEVIAADSSVVPPAAPEAAQHAAVSIADGEPAVRSAAGETAVSTNGEAHAPEVDASSTDPSTTVEPPAEVSATPALPVEPSRSDAAT
jgi:hypothetical protein